MPRKLTRLLLTVAVLALAAFDVASAQKLSHKARSLFEQKYCGKTYRLRIDLRPVERYVELSTSTTLGRISPTTSSR